MYDVLKKPLIILSALMFFASLFEPAFWYEGERGARIAINGVTAFGIGWFPAILGILSIFSDDHSLTYSLSWIANPVLWTAWVAIFKKSIKTTIAAGISALMLSLIFVKTKEITTPDGAYRNITMGAGYFLWVGSAAVTAICAFLQSIENW